MIILDDVHRDGASDTEAHQKPAIYQEGDQWVIRGSSLGMCPLRVAQRGIGRVEEVHDRVRMAWRLGHEHETIVKGRLRARGYVIEGEQNTIELKVGPNTILRGHTDADRCLLEVPGLGQVDCVLEVKSMNPHHYETWLARGVEGFPHYAKQISFYSLALGKPILYAVQCKEDLRLSLQFYADPPCSMVELQTDVLRIMGMITQLRAGARLTCDQHEEETFACPFDDLHVDPPARVCGKVDDPEMEARAHRYRELGEQISWLKKEQDEIKRQLGHMVDLSGFSKVKAGVLTVQWCAGRETTCWGEFLRDHPEMAQRLLQYKAVGSPYLRVDGPRKKKEGG